MAVRNWQRRAVAVGLLLGAATGGTGCSTMPMGIADLQQPPGLAQGTSAQYPVASGVRAPVLPATIPGEAPGRTAPAEIRLVGAPAQPEQATDLPAPRLADHPAVPPGPLPHPDVPTELRKAPLPAYIIEPPDILLIESPRALPDQPISGEHLVRPDGTVGLGLYGSVPVAGLTLDQARAVIEAHLTAFIKNPKVSVDVFAYNSKAVYLIADGAGFGQQAIRLPYTGNETVLDAICQIGGLPAVASKKHIWVARPSVPDAGCDLVTVLPVDWKGITQDGLTATNYQLLPGDRIYIRSDALLWFDGMLVKIVTPIERMFGVTLLGAVTVKQLQNMGRSQNFGSGTGTGTGF